MTTRWSVILRAASHGEPGAEESLDALCRCYWQPLYRYLRRVGKGPEDAEDLTQGFFVHLLSGDRLRRADPLRGRFRTFLLASLKNYLVSDWRSRQREKRGGGKPVLSLDCSAEERSYLREPADHLTPDRVYERRWAGRLVEEATARTREGFGRPELFDALRGHLHGAPGTERYLEVGARFEMTETAVKVTVHRLRGRFRTELMSLVRDTLPEPEDEEMVRREVSELLRLFAEGI